MMGVIIPFTPKRRDDFREAATLLLKAQVDFALACWGVSPNLPQAKIIPFPQKQKLIEAKR